MPESISKSTAAILLKSKRFTEISKSVPNSIEKILDEPKVCELVLETGKQTLIEFVSAELINLAGQLNVSHNLHPHQVDAIAEHLVTNYPTESMADFVLVFRRGAFGHYGSDFHRIDGSTIGNWMQKHSEEKAYYLERDNQKAKEESKSKDVVVNYERFRARLEKERAESREKKIREFELKVEAEEGRKQMQGYRPSTVEEVVSKQMHIEWIKANYDSHTGKPKDNWISEEEWIKLNF